jgi:hypothetical protein
MSYKVKQANIFGRIGSGIGKGLAEQVPKEIERNRLAKGLQDLENQKNLTPFQQFSRLSAIPGITPQMIQSGSELLRQQAQGQALSKLGGVQAENQPQAAANPFQGYQQKEETDQKPNSITTTAPVQATINPYIPPNQDQILAKAGELYNNNRELYPTPQAAISGAEAYFNQQKAQNEALQGQRQGQQDVQTRLQTELRTAAQNAGINVPNGTQVPDTVYQDIENKALDAVNSGQMTELDAAKHYKKELDTIARQYQALNTVGDLDYAVRDKNDIKRNLKEIRNDFKERNDLENLADSYISKNGLSPGKAYYLAFPTSDIKELNNELIKLKKLKPEITFERGFAEKRINPEIQAQKTLAVAPKLAKAMGKDGSPLAIATELEANGYDPLVWLDYLGKNKKPLDLSERQGRELQKPYNVMPTLNDFWLFTMSGLDKLVEQ